MTGEGIRGEFTVTESDEEVAVDADEQELVDQAEANYAAYVEDQSAQLLEKTQEFVDLYDAGDDDAARALYPVARTHWERIETVAESFGDLDPMMDAREADLEPGQEWTGWHLIEKDLWPQRAEDYTPLTDRERATYADDLLANTEELDSRVQELTYTVDAIANGSRGLLEEVATGKVTGEEEYWSRTDLWDFQANVDGAKVALGGRAADRGGEGRRPRRPADHALRRAPGAARRAARGRRLRVLRRPHARRGQGRSPTPSTRSPSRSRASPRRCCPDRRAVSRRGLLGGGVAVAGAAGAFAAGRTTAHAEPRVGDGGRRPGGDDVRLPRRAPGRHRHAGPGPAALRGVRRAHRLRATSSSTCCERWTARRRADDRAASPRVPAPSTATYACRPTTPARRSTCRRAA